MQQPLPARGDPVEVAVELLGAGGLDVLKPEVREAEDPVQRGAELVADHRHKRILGAVGLLGFLAGKGHPGRGAAQLQQRHRLPAEPLQCNALLRRQRPRLGAQHTQRAERQALLVDQRDAGVEAHVHHAGHQRVIRETGVPRRVPHHQRRARMQGVSAERLVPRRLAGVEANPRLEPLPVLVDQADERHRRAAKLRRQRGEVVEALFRLGIEDTVRPQGLQTLGFIQR